MKALLHPGGWPVRVLLCACLAVLLAAGGLQPATPYPKLLTDALGDAVQLVRPVDFSVEDNGVRARVIGYLSDGEEARIYLLVEDLQRDRITGDELRLLTERDYAAMYDASTQKPTISGEKLLGFDKNTSSVLLELEYGDLFHPTETEPPQFGNVISARLPIIGMEAGRTEARFNTKITLADIQAQKPKLLANPDPEGWSLAFGESETIFPDIPWMKISNIGVVEGQCRILTMPTSTEGIFGRLRFYFEDETGGPLTSQCNAVQNGVEFTRLTHDPEPEDAPDRTEHWLDIPQGDPSQIGLAVEASAPKHFIEGGWQLEFPMEASETVKTASKTAAITGEDGAVYQIEGVYITPFQAELYGAVTNSGPESELPEFQLIGKDGLPEFTSSTSAARLEKRFNVAIHFDTPRDPGDITAVRFGEAEIPVA